MTNEINTLSSQIKLDMSNAEKNVGYYQLHLVFLNDLLNKIEVAYRNALKACEKKCKLYEEENERLKNVK